MAEIRRTAPVNPISEFRQIAPTGGGMFAALADVADAAYDWLAPAAQREMAREGEDHGREVARQLMGQNRVASIAASSMGGPRGPAGPMTRYRDAIASIESAGRGDYAAIGPRHARLGRALGRYQIMEANIGPWSREALGREVSADEFMLNPAIQDAIFDHKFGGYLQQFGEEGAAQAWFAGPGGVGKLGRQDVLGTSVGAYGQKFLRALGGRTTAPTETVSSMGGAPAEPGEEPVTVQTRDGRIEPRLYSPLAGPILQAHNAAAQVAFNAEVLNKAAVDISNLAHQFELNPTGFAEAAQGYVEQIVEGAPEQFQTALRSNLETAVQRRFLGMVEDQHRDTRQRAINSTGALMDRYKGELADALASGDAATIAAAQANLDDVLRAREALPGLAWTPAQSENVRIAASQAADRERERRAKQASDEIKGQLQTIIAARKAGQTSDYEAILQSPDVMEMHPDLAREALSWIAAGELLPGFSSAPEAERRAALNDIRQMPVNDMFQLDIVKALEARDKDIRKAWDTNPIEAAREYLPEKPPELPSVDDPKYAEALAARRDYALALQGAGYTDDAVIFTADEAKALTELLGVASPPEVRAAVAGALVAGLGSEAPRGFRQLSEADPVIRHAGMLIARGVNPALAVEALHGQALLKDRLVQLPSQSVRSSAFGSDVAAALSFIPNGAAVTNDIMRVAEALYAARGQGLDPGSDEAKALMEQSVQRALGQSADSRGRTIGGVQPVNGHATLLPPSVSGEALNRAFGVAMGTQARSGGLGDQIRFAAGAIVGADQAMPEAWRAATEMDGQPGSIPYAAGAPLPPDAAGDVRFVPVRDNIYRMEVVRQGARIPVEGADGKLLYVDVERLIEATR